MQEVEGDRYEYEMRVLIACARAGIPMESITIETVYENGNEGSHFHPIRDSYRIYKVILGSFVKFMGTSILCVGIDQGLAWLLRDVLLAHMGIEPYGSHLGQRPVGTAGVLGGELRAEPLLRV